jgi:hypothetical protein
MADVKSKPNLSKTSKVIVQCSHANRSLARPTSGCPSQLQHGFASPQISHYNIIESKFCAGRQDSTLKTDNAAIDHFCQVPYHHVESTPRRKYNRKISKSQPIHSSYSTHGHSLGKLGLPALDATIATKVPSASCWSAEPQRQYRTQRNVILPIVNAHHISFLREGRSNPSDKVNSQADLSTGLATQLEGEVMLEA